MAAGHRACALCRREDYDRLVALWRELHPGQVGADAIDAQLHGERVGAGHARAAPPRGARSTTSPTPPSSCATATPPAGTVGNVSIVRAAGSVAAVTTLAERLGYAPDDRLLIINCDDLGSCHAANVGVLRRAARRRRRPARRSWCPCPWARDAAAELPRRGRRRAPHAQRRVRRLPLGPDHPRARRCSTATAASPARSTTCGTTPTSTRCGAECRAQIERAHPLGLRRQPPRLPPGRTAAAARVLRRLPRAGGRVRAAAPPAVDDQPSAASASRSASWPPRRACVFPDHFDHDWRAGSRERVVRARSPTCSRASPRSTCSRRSTRPRSAPCRRAGPRLDRRPRAGRRRRAPAATLLDRSRRRR